MSEPIQQTLEELRHDLSAVTLLVEFLYCMHFKSLPNSDAKFKEFSDVLKAQLENLAFPGLDAALSDHAAQGWYEALAPILDRIAARLRDPQWSPRPSGR